MTDTTTGVVDILYDREDGWYGVKLEDGRGWFNDNGSAPKEISEGDNVAIKYDEENQIMNIKRTQAGNSGPNSGSKAGGGQPQSSTHLSKNERILVNTAFQKAVDKVSLDDANDQGEHLEQVNSLTNGYIDVMKKQMNEFKEDSDE